MSRHQETLAPLRPLPSHRTGMEDPSLVRKSLMLSFGIASPSSKCHEGDVVSRPHVRRLGTRSPASCRLSFPALVLRIVAYIIRYLGGREREREGGAGRGRERERGEKERERERLC